MPKLTRQQGFTLVELIIVVVVLAVLAATAFPRFIGKAGVEEITIQDRLISLLRLSQTQAMQNTSQKRLFNLAAAGLTPADGSVQIRLFNHKTAAGSVISEFWFNAYGQPGFVSGNPATFSQAANGLRFEIQGTVQSRVCIESEGYIHPC
ncbi:prepilin-type N-terminal cleavage/methylation domain-containing protein [Rheinheimera sp.]|uniref:prepilin-type N-terminal cleavage/methylation domain-containing protein n=1 Tax=Rheinheimera sp. TaxID=1869214 RepID=UPI00307E2F46